MAEVERRLKKLPDLESAACVWTDDDTVQVWILHFALYVVLAAACYW